MIGWISGTVLERNVTGASGELIVDTGGVGYRITVVGDALARSAVGEETSLHIHHHFWEADQKLFGFASRGERVAFVGLLAAHKVGPALALAIISTYNPLELSRILSTDDIDSLCAVPGVGKKTAQRLLVDLRSSLVLPSDDGGSAPGEGLFSSSEAAADVRDALAALGYTTEEMKPAMASIAAELAEPGAESGALLKLALRSLAEA